MITATKSQWSFKCFFLQRNRTSNYTDINIITFVILSVFKCHVLPYLKLADISYIINTGCGAK